MRKNIFLIVMLAAIFVFAGAMNKGAKADVDPVEMIKNAKTPVYFHSLAGLDSLVHEEPTQVCNWWMSIYPDNTYPHVWHVIGEKDNGIPGLNPLDQLRIEYKGPGSGTGSLWIDVLEVTKTLILTLEPDHLDTMYIEYTGGYDSLMNPLTDPDYYPVCTWWHEIWPEFCRIYHLSSWVDTDGGGYLSYCDTIDLTEWWHVVSVTQVDTTLELILETLEAGVVENRILHFSGGLDPDSVNRALMEPVCTWWHEEHPDTCKWWHIASWHDNGNATLDYCDTLDFKTWWHVEDVAIDIEVHSIDPPDMIPSMTSWGLIILAALLVASAVFVYLRRKKVMVSA